MAAADKQASWLPTLTSPATSAEAVTPSDSVQLASVSRSLFVGGAGTITALMADDTVGVFTGVPAGFLLPVRVKRVNSTGTTATNITSLS